MRLYTYTPSGEKGMVLLTVVLLVAVLMALGTTAILQTSTDIKISGNYRVSRQAFYDADAGVQYLLNRLSADLGDSDPTTVNLTANPITLSYSTPGGFSFTLPTALISLGSNRYRCSVTGNGPNNSAAVLEVGFFTQRKSAFDFGLFTDGLLDIKADAHIYSYDSRDTPNPDTATFPGASTGEADIGSNTQINTYMSTYIDGTLALGADSSYPPVDATWKDQGTPTVNGEAGTKVGRVDPDPLGANDPNSDLYNKFIDIVATNNNTADTNGAACPLAGSTDINLGNGETMTLTAGDYYITSIILKSGATLEIDATAGPVNIYLNGIVDAEDGDLEAKNGSAINNASQPTDFAIFSNSTQDIVFKHSSDYKGIVYAPNAHVEMKNSADVYGLVWGKTAAIHNSGEFYFDEALKDKFLSPYKYSVEIASWKDTAVGQ